MAVRCPLAYGGAFTNQLIEKYEEPEAIINKGAAMASGVIYGKRE